MKQLLAVLAGPTCYDPDAPAGDGGTMGGNGEFLDVWNGVPVSGSDIVECNLIYMLQVAHWLAGGTVCLVVGCLPVQVFINLQ